MLKNKEKLKNDLIYAVKKMCEEKDLSVTTFFRLDNDGENTWAIVFGWVDGFEPSNQLMASDTYRLCGKCAYASNKSLMHEYDMDWLMPTCDDDSDVDDTEISFESEDEIEDNIDWLIKEFERYQATYIHKE